MNYKLSTQEIKEKFGDIIFDVIYNKKNIRTSCVQKKLDGSVLVYSTVVFYDEGIDALGKFHKNILEGSPLGETIKDSGIVHDRSISKQYSVEINFGLKFLFNTNKRFCVGRKIKYTIKGRQYASINEFYNPNFFSTLPEIVEHLMASPINEADWFVIARLQSGFEKEYLKLTHGFLKKPMHVGIEDQETFIKETQKTLEILMKDLNTRIFVFADKESFVGYAAINVHPALHINGLECMIRELYITENRQGKGIGSILMEYVERYAKNLGCTRIALATKWDDEKQRSFYEGLGYLRRCDFVVKKI